MIHQAVHAGTTDRNSPCTFPACTRRATPKEKPRQLLSSRSSRRMYGWLCLLLLRAGGSGEQIDYKIF